ncbi:MAG TPA: NAD-dependent succinate-semialdehyde dehydrogenase [Oceanipulchritudo sp.]|nr:NAD-dependent succinate-semialdehyde dehydrogenase [Oceanipulchritudo sp.]
MKISSINPATGKPLREYTSYSREQVDAILESAAQSAAGWADVPVERRALLVAGAARILRERHHDLAVLITQEMGKPIQQSLAEIEKCAWVCDYYSQHGPAFLADEPVETGDQRSYVAYQPIGLVLAVMPWNFPFWQVFRFAAPALTAGNGIVLKHASSVCGCALAIERIFLEAGFPHNLFRSLLIPAGEVDHVIASPHVRAATLTGSEGAGRSVAACAGSHLKKTVLELGGSDPYLILEDADLDLAVEKCVTSRLNNGGQTCIAAKRFIVVPAVREGFEARLIRQMVARKLGDPMRGDTDIGPMAREDLRQEVHQQVTQSVKAGARLLVGGQLPDPTSPGFFYPATVLTGVRPGMPAYHEETFGPVAAVLPAADEEEAIRIANDTRFGLGAAVFSRNIPHAEVVARRLQAGCVAINDFVKSDPRLPFGGVKASGYGRELARHGLLEFLNIKSVSVATS